MDQVERVEYLQTGIIYLKNGTTLVIPGSFSDFNSKRCGENNTVIGGLVRLVPRDVDRYSPTGKERDRLFL